MVKEVKENCVVVQNEKKELIEIPFGVLVWAAVSGAYFGAQSGLFIDHIIQGNVGRPLTRSLMAKVGEAQSNKRGLQVDEHLRLAGTDGIFAMFVIPSCILQP